MTNTWSKGMGRSRLFAAALSLIWFCSAVVSFRAGAEEPPGTFKLFKLKTVDGAEKTLQDFPGKATLVSFFFPSCKFCNAEFPEVQKMYDRYKDLGLSVVWINVVPAENKKVADWLAKGQYTVPVLIGSSQAGFQRDYKLKMTPTHNLLSPDGKVLFHAAGYEPGDETKLESAIQAALGITP